MKKAVLLTIAAGTLISLWIGYDLIHTLYAHEKKRNQEAGQRILSETNIKEIERIDHYHGTEPLPVAFGRDENGRRVIAWVFSDRIVTEYADQGRSREEIVEMVKERVSPTVKIYHVVPAIEDEQKMWEVLFKDREGKLNYHYYGFYLGTFLKSYRLNQ